MNNNAASTERRTFSLRRKIRMPGPNKLSVFLCLHKRDKTGKTAATSVLK